MTEDQPYWRGTMYICREKGMSPMLDKRRALHMMQSIYNRCREENISREKGMSSAQKSTSIKEIHVSTSKNFRVSFRLCLAFVLIFALVFALVFTLVFASFCFVLLRGSSAFEGGATVMV